jgi:predicted PurR-regulated permease PerM
MQQDHSTKKYFLFALLIASAVFTFFMLWPFLTIIILSLSLTSLFYPMYRWFLKKTNVSWVAALLTVVSFVLIVGVPLFLLGSLVLNQSHNLYSWIVGNGGIDRVTDSLDAVFKRLAVDPVEIKRSVSGIIGKLTNSIGTIFTAALSTVFSFLLVALTMFYLLKDGAQWKALLIRLSPLSDDSTRDIITTLTQAANGIIRGYLLIALIQGFLMGVGMYVFRVPHAALWGVLAGIASLVPTIGTALVSVPTIIFLAIMGRSGAAIGFTLWAGLLVGAVDNLLNPIIVGRTIDIHPLLVLFAVLGGLALLGPVGILMGPLVMSFMYALLSVYKSEVAT